MNNIFSESESLLSDRTSSEALVKDCDVFSCMLNSGDDMFDIINFFFPLKDLYSEARSTMLLVLFFLFEARSTMVLVFFFFFSRSSRFPKIDVTKKGIPHRCALGSESPLSLFLYVCIRFMKCLTFTMVIVVLFLN